MMGWIGSSMLGCDLFTPGADTTPEPASQTAMYRLDFDATWSAETHPTDIPNPPLFSPLICVTHKDIDTFWAVGAIATPGIERMAEHGNNETLRDEIAPAMTSGDAGVISEASGPFESPGVQSVTFEISQTFPRVTAVSMIAPSPDWFVGVNGLVLFDGAQWADQIVVQLFPHDAGTDNGVSYESANSNTNPATAITEIAGYPFETNGDIPALGTFTFTRIDNGN